MGKIQTIGVLTSGGDAPGMNAAIRAVTRASIYNGWKVKGIYRGWEGLINNEIKDFTSESVSGTINRGGTILRTARSKDFLNEEGRARAYENIKANGIDALVVIGGNGSLAGAQVIAAEYDLPCVGLPGTIDNDLYGTDTTIGYDTALNTIMDCVDKIRDTANSHNRIFFVEVMGRDAGFLAQNAAIATGAEAAIIPEDKTDVDQLATFIGRGVRKSKNSSIVLVSESKKDGTGGAQYYADRLVHEYPEFEARVTILGHLQRGGIPTAQDRILASRLGVAAIDALKDGQRNIMVGVKNDQIVYVPFNKAIRIDKPIDRELINVLNVLSIEDYLSSQARKSSTRERLTVISNGDAGLDLILRRPPVCFTMLMMAFSDTMQLLDMRKKFLGSNSFPIISREEFIIYLYPSKVII